MTSVTKPDRWRDPTLARESLAIRAGYWRYPTDSELPALVDQLAKLIGRESKLASWQRRLAIFTSDGQTPLLVVNAPAIVTSEFAGDHMSPWTNPRTSETVQLVFPLADGVELLASPHNPELEIERRAQLCAKHAEEERRKREEATKVAKAAQEQAEALAKERTAFRADDWEQKLSDDHRVLLALAVAIEGHAPKVASGIRATVKAALAGPLPFPRVTWWDGVDWPKPKKGAPRVAWGMHGSAAKVIASIPPDKLQLLRIRHGFDNDQAVAAAWVNMQEMDAATDSARGP